MEMGLERLAEMLLNRIDSWSFIGKTEGSQTQLCHGVPLYAPGEPPTTEMRALPSPVGLYRGFGLGSMFRESIMIELDFGKTDGLVPAIAQDAETGEVLMLAYMNRESWRLTVETGIAHYWSRSRNKLWKKGETSGNLQEVREIRVDCDDDTVLLRIKQIGGAACHTGNRSCFYRKLQNDTLVQVADSADVTRPGDSRTLQ